MFAPTLRRSLAIVGAAALAVIAVPLTITNTASAAAGDPVVTLESGTNECQGVRTTPGSENTNKRLVSGDLEPGGVVTFEISYPVDAADVGQDFQITDCVFINDVAALKYTVSFVPNNTAFLLSFQLTIPADAPIGAQYCNYAKTTQSPSASPASNRKAGPACFFVGGDLRIVKVAAGDANHTPLVGAAFSVVCTTGTETIPPVIISGLSGSTTFSTGAYRASGTAATGIIAIAGPEGTPCVVTETAPPAGYDLPAAPTFSYTIPKATLGQEIDYIADPRTKNTTSIGTAASSATVGTAIHDTATLTGATADAGGTITFTAFGPSDTPACGGAPVFTSAAITVSGNGNYGSGDFTPATAGIYYWIASYSGDANNLPSAGTCGDAGETSVISKRTTLIGTAASTSTVGAPIHDTATLSGATATAGGTITFTAFGPSDTPNCSGAPVFTSAAIPVSGNGNYGSGDFTPATAGSYYWIASYTGDTNNLPVAGTCGDTGETSTVGKQPTVIGTAASAATVGTPIHDTATLGGATATAGGTITFTAFGPSDTADCSGTPKFTSAAITVSGNGSYGSGDFTPATAGSYYWIASYSGDTNNLPVAGKCGDAGETSTVGKQPTVIGTAASTSTVGDPIHDTATLSGATATAGGTITFTAFGPSATPGCDGTPVFTSAAIPVSGNGAYGSGNFTPATSGSYYWIASYSGDTNNLPVTGKCGDTGETSTVGLRPTLIATAASSQTVGAAIHDIATLSGATATAGGSITFRAWANADCTGDPAFTSAAITVSGNGSYGSGDFTPATAGSYNWIASYSGDGNNLPASGACGDSGETSTVGKLTTVVGTDATSADLGGAISDTATLAGAGGDAGGTITFNLYGPSDSPDCTGAAIFTSTVAVTGSGTYHSDSFTPTAFGNYYWTAAYSGDENNLAASGACGDDGETSVVNALAVSPTPTHSPESHSTQPLAVTGAGPVGDQLGWAMILLVVGGAVLLVGKRRGYRRTH